MRNRFLSFVAHVRETKGFASDFAVAGIDHQMMLVTKFPRELQNVDLVIVFDAGKRF